MLLLSNLHSYIKKTLINIGCKIAIQYARATTINRCVGYRSVRYAPTQIREDSNYLQGANDDLNYDNSSAT